MIRARLSRILSELHMGPLRRRHNARVRDRQPDIADDYEDLHPVALALLTGDTRSEQPVIRLLLPVGAPAALFAGMRTAIVFAANLAVLKEMPLEICHFDRPRRAREKTALAEIVTQVSGLPSERVSVRNVWEPGSTHPDDLHVATFWETALAAQVAARAGVLTPENVIYLVQDYEPEFYAGSSESALCKATYHAGFRLVVNSAPLADYLMERESLKGAVEFVFRPELDLSGIERAARARTPSRRVRITFYGRPGNTRNSYQLGVASLRIASRRLKDGGIEAEFVSVGEKHPDIEVSGGRVRSLGKLAWNEYFRVLADTDVMLSFQQTPHPSHPPLDAVASGTFAVMNEMAHTRGVMSSRLIATDSDPVRIAESVVAAARRVLAGDQLDHLDREFVEGLGRPLSEVVADVATRV